MHKKLILLTISACVMSLAATSLGGNVDPSLVGWWMFEDGEGTVAKDVSGKSVDGVFTGAVAWGRDTQHRGVLLFDGTTAVPEYVFIDGAFSLPVYTMALWFRVDGGSGSRDIFSAYARGVRHGILLEVQDARLRYLHRYPLGTGGGTNIYTATSYADGAWHHATMVKSLDQIALYIDGQEARQGGPGSPQADVSKFNPGDTFGIALGILDNERAAARLFPGAMDDVRVYNRPLTPQEIQAVVGAQPWPYAWSPTPADRAVHPDTWVNLIWRPGPFAVSHDLYFGEDPMQVEAGTGDTFRGNQTTAMFFVGAGLPADPYPGGLVPGTTYYWRIDEVNTSNPSSPWKGDVWSFTVPSKKAYKPNPPNGAKFIAVDATLAWTAGFGAKLHTAYFGTDPNTVANATGGTPVVTATLVPGPLQAGKTYYWRVDEFDGALTYKGDVWSFTTAGPGGGVRGDYYGGIAFGSQVLTRTDPQINFNWADAAPDPAVAADSFSVRWAGQVEAAFTETYTFYTNSDDGVRLWVDGVRLVNNWTDHTVVENSGNINLVAGNTYSLLMEYYENTGPAVAELLWSSPRTPKQAIPQAALSLPLRASSPSPANGIVGVKLASTLLTWTPGDFAASHDVYFGTDANAVKNATTSSPEFKGNKPLANASYDPGKLAWDTTYYWRVDEVNNANAGSPWKGSLWSFSTGDFLLVDNFEAYNDIDPPNPASNRIFDKWIDGFGTTTNGGLVGNALPPYTEQIIVHSGRQSMPYAYDNNLKFSEATLTLTEGRDWTQEGVATLSLWFRGAAANAGERMYVALNGTAVVVHSDPNVAQTITWTEWSIPLQSFASQGVNLTNVTSLAIGFGTRGNATVAGGTGQMYFDDIRLYRPRVVAP